MKAVQTFWTPKAHKLHQVTGGWIDTRFHLMSWTLSAFLLKRHFPVTALYTDVWGKHILIDSLELPFDEVYLTQENLDEQYPAELWVMRKMHTYSLMTEPFVHVDGDAFISKALPDDLIQANVFVQNVQQGFSCYARSIAELEAVHIPVPAFIDKSCQQYQAVNMGIVGGNDAQLFRHFFYRVNQFLTESKECIMANKNRISRGYLNTLLEEFFFYHYLTQANQSFATLLPPNLDGRYSKLSNLAGDYKGYAHVIGDNKKNLFYCKQMESKLKHLFPIPYQRVVDLLQSQEADIRDRFHYSAKDPFIESNSRLLAKGLDTKITFTNSASQLKKYKRLHEPQLCEAIQFEKEKHLAIMEQLERKDDFIKREEDRFAWYESYLAALPIELRLGDVLQYNDSQPVFLRKHIRESAQAEPQYLSLALDFKHGFEHVGELFWDPLALLILGALVEKAIPVVALLETVLNKTHPLSPSQRDEMIKRVDIRLKELFLTGLVDYTTSSSTHSPPHRSPIQRELISSSAFMA